MKTLTRSTLTLVLALAMAAAMAPAASAEVTETTTIHIETTSYGSAEIELTDMEVDETARYWTDSGEPVDVTRTEDGYRLEIADKTINVGGGGEGCGGECVDVEATGTGEGEHVIRKRIKKVIHDGEDGECEDCGEMKRRVKVIEKVGDGEGEDVYVKVRRDGEELDLEELEAAGHQVIVMDGDEVDLEKIHEHVGDAGEVTVMQGDDGKTRVYVHKDHVLPLDPDPLTEGDGEQIRIRVERRVIDDGE